MSTTALSNPVARQPCTVLLPSSFCNVPWALGVLGVGAVDIDVSHPWTWCEYMCVCSCMHVGRVIWIAGLWLSAHILSTLTTFSSFHWLLLSAKLSFSDRYCKQHKSPGRNITLCVEVSLNYLFLLAIFWSLIFWLTTHILCLSRFLISMAVPEGSARLSLLPVKSLVKS